MKPKFNQITQQINEELQNFINTKLQELNDIHFKEQTINEQLERINTIEVEIGQKEDSFEQYPNDIVMPFVTLFNLDNEIELFMNQNMDILQNYTGLQQVYNELKDTKPNNEENLKEKINQTKRFKTYCESIVNLELVMVENIEILQNYTELQQACDSLKNTKPDLLNVALYEHYNLVHSQFSHYAEGYKKLELFMGQNIEILKSYTGLQQACDLLKNTKLNLLDVAFYQSYSMAYLELLSYAKISKQLELFIGQHINTLQKYPELMAKYEKLKTIQLELLNMSDERNKIEALFKEIQQEINIFPFQQRLYEKIQKTLIEIQQFRENKLYLQGCYQLDQSLFQKDPLEDINKFILYIENNVKTEYLKKVRIEKPFLADDDEDDEASENFFNTFVTNQIDNQKILIEQNIMHQENALNNKIEEKLNVYREKQRQKEINLEIKKAYYLNKFPHLTQKQRQYLEKDTKLLLAFQQKIEELENFILKQCEIVLAQENGQQLEQIQIINKVEKDIMEKESEFNTYVTNISKQIDSKMNFFSNFAAYAFLGTVVIAGIGLILFDSQKEHTDKDFQ